ncbi:hypothetical protein [Bacillus cereus]|uniref:hypothetical protein n=1 Tax=Bacillus cereus TaxID=1396 RepID=UPI00201E1E18|nr:hypothetical protein [Bacillus cereus]
MKGDINSPINDKNLAELAGKSYIDKKRVVVDIGNHEEVWKRVEIPSSVPLHNSINSFDATIYKNDETKQIVIAFRGSWEPPDFL